MMNSDLDIKQTDTPEGEQQSPRGNDAADVAFEAPLDADHEAAGDALPLDGSLSLNDTEPLPQDGLHADSDRVLVGSEAGGTARASIQASDATDRAVDSKGAYGAAPERATDGSDDVNADPDLNEAIDYVKSGDGERPGQTAGGN